MQRFTDFLGAPIGIAGAGRVAQAVGKLLASRGEPVSFIASRRSEQARHAAAFIGPNVRAVSFAELGQQAGRILIAVPDSALESVAGALGMASGIVLHTCGAKGPEALSALAKRGIYCGAIHPLQTISDPESGAEALDGVSFAVAGDPVALEWAEHIVRVAKGRVLRIASERRPLYHAAAVMASNYVTALMSAAEELLIAAGVDSEEALPALGPLARTSLENTLRQGPMAALTGPIERGDVATVESHLAALENMKNAPKGACTGESIRNAPEGACTDESMKNAPKGACTLYRAAGLQTLALARRKGLSAATERALEASLT